MVELNKDTMIEILSKNFNFKKVNDPFDNIAIEMEAQDAFRYSLIEGSPYLVNEYGFTCKGRMNVFYHRSSLNRGYYTYCPGLFGVKRNGNDILLDEGHSPYYIQKRYPKIFKGKKIIIFAEHNSQDAESRSELERMYFNKLINEKKNPANYLLTVVTDRQSEKENFLEFVSCQYFNSQDYITECQVPFQNNSGIPDFAAYKFPKFKELIDNKFIEKGSCIQEIAAACVFDNKPITISDHQSYEILIGEAKTGQPDAQDQVLKHIQTQLADYIFEIIPFKINRETNCGLLSFDPSTLMINFDEGPPQTKNSRIFDEDEVFLENYVKFYILANLSIEKIKEKFIDKNNLDSESAQLIRKVTNYDFSNLIDFVKSEM